MAKALLEKMPLALRALWYSWRLLNVIFFFLTEFGGRMIRRVFGSTVIEQWKYLRAPQSSTSSVLATKSRHVAHMARDSFEILPFRNWQLGKLTMALITHWHF